MARDGLYDQTYDALRRIARAQRRRLRAGETLSTTALVSEAWMKLSQAADFSDRDHYLRTAATAMRQVLVDAARASFAGKRGSGLRPLSLDATDAVQVCADPASNADALLALDEALSALAAQDPRQAEVVELRYFGGYTDIETARLLGVTDRTVRRLWDRARMHLFDAMKA